MCIVAGLDLGNATFSSPVRQQRNTCQSTLSTLAVHATRLNNQIGGNLGQVLPVPAADGSLFSLTPSNPTSGSAPSPLGGANLHAPSTPTPPHPPGAPSGRTIVVDGRPLCLASTPADQDTNPNNSKLENVHGHLGRFRHIPNCRRKRKLARKLVN